MDINAIAGLYVSFKAVCALFRTKRFGKLYGKDTALIKNLRHKQESLCKDEIECSKSYLFMHEKEYYIYKNAIIRQAR